MSQNAVRQYFMRLCKDGKLKRYDTGVYYIPTKTVFGTDSTLSRNRVIQRKYLETKDGEVCGFYTGMQLLNSVGLTTQVPTVYEISTNAASKDYREVNITKEKVKKNIIYYPERIYRCLYEREVF